MPSDPSSRSDASPISQDSGAALTTAAADTSDGGALVLPGDYSQRTSVADLEARFGRANVKIVEGPANNGPSDYSVELFPDDPLRRAYVAFHYQQASGGVASISVRDAGSLWRGKHGVHVGMSFANLRKLNGKPFLFSGFDGDHRGWVRDQWSPALDGDDGTLGALDVGENEHMYFGVDLGLRGRINDRAAGTYPIDDSISSDDPRYPRLGELVEISAIVAYTSLDDEWE